MRIVHNEHVDLFFIRKGNVLPLTIEGILGDGDSSSCQEVFEPFLWMKARFEEFAEDTEYRNAFCLMHTASFHKSPSLKGLKKDSARKAISLLKSRDLCCALHDT